MSIEYKASGDKFVSLYIRGKRAYMFDKRPAPAGERWVTLDAQGDLIEKGDPLQYLYGSFDEVMTDVQKNFTFS